MSSVPGNVFEALQSIADVAVEFSPAGGDQGAVQADRLQGWMILTVGYLRDAHLSLLTSTGAVVGTAGQRLGSRRCSWDDLCAWAKAAVAAIGNRLELVQCLHLHGFANLSAAVGSCMYFQYGDLRTTSRRATALVPTGVAEAGDAYVTWPLRMADSRVLPELLAWTGCSGVLADLADAVGHGRGCQPLSGRSPGAIAAMSALKDRFLFRFHAGVMP